MSIGKRLRLWVRRFLKKKQPRPGSLRSLRDFEQLIGYQFQNRSLLDTALKHRSIIVETGELRNETNERLEFLGDAVLDLVVSETLYHLYPDAKEGYLARLKSLAVSGRQLAHRARRFNLGHYLQLGEGEAKSGGRTRSSILEDALEAVIGAIFLDGGLREAKTFIKHFVVPDLDDGFIREREQNYKSLLLEFTQGQAMGTPRYRVISEEGPDHAKTFVVEALISEKRIGTGIGNSKKKAEQQAAKNAAIYFGLKLVD